MRWLVPWLAGIFVVVQFAGVVSRPANAQSVAMAVTLHQHHHHPIEPEKQLPGHPNHQGNNEDQCCALHLLTGVVPAALNAGPVEVLSLKLSSPPGIHITGFSASPLDRPPRSL